MGDDTQQERARAADAAPTEESGSSDDPNTSTEGLLDEERLLEHAREVDDAIQEARRRNA
jgi:hypothetical protein